MAVNVGFGKMRKRTNKNKLYQYPETCGVDSTCSRVFTSYQNHRDPTKQTHIRQQRKEACG